MSTGPAAAAHAAAAPAPTTSAAAPAPQRRTETQLDRESARPTRSLAKPLGRLAVASALVCGLNGVAASAYVESDAAKVGTVVTAQQTSLSEAKRIADDLPRRARAVRADSTAERAYLDDIATGASHLGDATARAASGPPAVSDDAARLSTLSGSYAKYVATVERARATRSEAVYREADRLRSSTIDPTLDELTTRTAARGGAARQAGLVSTGLLGATTLASLLTLLGGSVWLARRTKRVLNPGLLGAALLTLAVSTFAFRLTTTILPPVLVGPGLLVGGILAAALAWAGVGQRRKEYR